ncbi:MAG: zinc ribbon domain-containing protein [Streptococcus sp.]|jgi:putative FmdB family regulatory protein|nr:zinc ribbon domain-containing protein [Streptococcus sp.]
MPIYEYRCNTCNHELEIIQKLSDPELSDCPACGQPELKKLISAVGFRLKGSGWYETDFKSGDKKKNVVKDDSPTVSEGKNSAGGASCSTCATPAVAAD